MRKSLALLLASIVIPSAALAQKSGHEGEKVVCKTVNLTGSRLASRRICKMRQEWDQERRQAQKDVADQQSLTPPNPSPVF